jgi:mannose-6-phosphate isomerase-like protein (cupin superfamily)
MHSYQGMIVCKPWGHEYLMYENNKIGLWYLYIKHGAQTSLHCHPRKKTGLVLLSGEAEIRFLNDALKLKAPSKLMIREGLFHSTAAISLEGVTVIEIETPPHKRNLVRLEDEYERKDKPYEGASETKPLTPDCIQLNNPEKNKEFRYAVGSCVLIVEKIEDILSLSQRCADEIIVVLEGGLVSRGNELILGPGDIVTIATLNRLAKTFPAPQGISLLTIKETDKPYL